MDVRKELLQDISEEDARKEGFDSRQHFMEYWEKLYPSQLIEDVSSWTANPFVTVIDFEVLNWKGEPYAPKQFAEVTP